MVNTNKIITSNPASTIDPVTRQFVIDHLLTKTGRLNPRALEKYNISKEQAYTAFNNTVAPTCKECANPTTFISFQKGYALFCSVSCAATSKDTLVKKRNTLESNFGVLGFKSEQIQNKKKSTNINRYGVEHRRQDADYVDTLKQEHLIKYGTTSPATTDSANAKRANTNISRYGSVNPVSNSTVYDKIKSTNIEKYGVSTALLLEKNRVASVSARTDVDVYSKLNSQEWLENNKNVPSTVLADNLGVAWSTILTYFKKHNVERPNIIVSKQEMQLVEFLQQHNVRYETSNRTILNGQEIDIFLPDYNIGIEVDGLYWHSEQFKSDKYYHATKNQLAASKNIQLIHITDSEIALQTNVVYNRLLAKLGKSQKLYARKCTVVEVDNNTYSKFMALHHIQGAAVASVRLGLKFNDEIVAIMSFSKSRYNKNYQWELIRYASIGTIVGGASRLFKHFIKTRLPESIISYSDIRWNSGKVYSDIGMTYNHSSPPNYWYIINGRLVHRSGYQKHKLKNKLKLFNENKTEKENMEDNQYTRYWDCGNKVFVWSKQ